MATVEVTGLEDGPPCSKATSPSDQGDQGPGRKKPPLSRRSVVCALAPSRLAWCLLSVLVGAGGWVVVCGYGWWCVGVRRGRFPAGDIIMSLGEPASWRCVSGGVLLSRTLAGAVPSALGVLASGFGMGPGVALPL